MEVKRVAEEWEIWDEEEEVEKSEAEAKKLVPEKFYKWIKVFGKKKLERMPTRKIWDHAIDMKEGFVPRKGKVYLLSREEREEVHEFIQEQLRKGYIRPSKSSQTASVFFVGKKNVKIVDSRLHFYFLSLYFIFFLCLFLLFSIFRTTQVRVYQSRCHISHKLMA